MTTTTKHQHINNAGRWDLSPKEQVTALTSRGLGTVTSDSRERERKISRYLLDGGPIHAEPFAPTTRVIKGFEKR